jgi:hypothetical protein
LGVEMEMPGGGYDVDNSLSELFEILKVTPPEIDPENCRTAMENQGAIKSFDMGFGYQQVLKMDVARLATGSDAVNSVYKAVEALKVALPKMDSDNLRVFLDKREAIRALNVDICECHLLKAGEPGLRELTDKPARPTVFRESNLEVLETLEGSEHFLLIAHV